MLMLAVVATIVQGVSGPGAPSPSPDSADVAAAARRAQQRFESLRRASLPVRDREHGRRCEARIGIYCYWYNATDVQPSPREHRRVTAARAALLTVLDSLGEDLPRDGVIFGQRVHYRIDGGDTTGAVRLAERGCGADAWWCAAVLGHALHVAGRFADAERAFERALAAMDSERRCAWTDPSVLLPADARRALERLPCAARAGSAERIWWLADPLLADDGNDFRTEFLARRTAAFLESHGTAMYDLRWSGDVEEMLLRYGWPVWWTREATSPIATLSTRIITGHERVPSFAFVPRSRVLRDTLAVPDDADWDPTADTPAARYGPAWARSWRELPAQLARFLDGDTLLLVAAFTAETDTALREPVARLALSPGVGRRAAASAPVSRARGTLTLRVASHTLSEVALAEVAVRDSSSGAVARHRAGLRPLGRNGFTLSDLLLHMPGEPRANGRAGDRAGAAASAFPGTSVRRGKLGVYWEAYCDERAPFTVTLHLARTGHSWLARAATRLGIRDAPGALVIRWRDTPLAEGPCAARSIALDTSELDAGWYDLELLVRSDAGGSATARRRLRLVR